MSQKADDSTTRASDPRPRVWCLTGDKAGDRAQILNLACALEWPFEEWALRYNDRYRTRNRRLGATLATLEEGCAAQLRAPWPDLILSSGRRAVPVARWIRARSGGRTRLVFIGRPRAPLRWFDLVVTTAQYSLPDHRRVLRNRLTLNRLDPARVEASLAAWRSEFERFARPRVAVLVGGDAPPLHLPPERARALGEQLRELHERSGGSLLVTTSPRTSDEAARALFDALPGGAWTRPFERGAESPYAALIELADRVVVTGDSASMISEVCAHGRRVHVAPLELRLGRGAAKRLRKRARWEAFAPTAWLYRLARAEGLVDLPRDMEAFLLPLRESGLVRALGDLSDDPAVAPDGELPRVVERVRALLG